MTPELQNLIDKVIDQIVIDVNAKDLTSIEELLKFVPEENLIGFLPEEEC
jgi:hypothetical protein|tara:strand:+ start:244 stop:393 length:150 start_codon:yes stop_codon:yes gene_type:complete